MNAIAPTPRPPKRPFGTGAVCPRGGVWRYRLPGGRVERSGFATREEAEAALNDALAGRDWKLIELRKAVKRAVRLAHELGVDLGSVTRSVNVELMIDGARTRRAKERAARMAAEEERKR